MPVPSIPDPCPTRASASLSLEPLQWLLLSLVSMVMLHLFVPIERVVPRGCFWGGATVALLGLVISNVASVRLRRAGTPLEIDLAPTVLLTDGLFARTRNPIYLGMLLLLSGEAIMLGTLGALLPLPVFLAVLRYRFVADEERVLQGSFGGAYDRYCRRVRRWL